jgi:hypothetical protein
MLNAIERRTAAGQVVGRRDLSRPRREIPPTGPEWLSFHHATNTRVSVARNNIRILGALDHGCYLGLKRVRLMPLTATEGRPALNFR